MIFPKQIGRQSAAIPEVIDFFDMISLPVVESDLPVKHRTERRVLK